MTAEAKSLYTAKVRTIGGREGTSRSSDGRLDIRLSTPGGPGGGTNPEQLFAAGWSACFEGAMTIAARKLNITLPADLAIDAEVDLNVAAGAYSLNVSVPGLDRNVARALVMRRIRPALFEGHAGKHRRRDQPHVVALVAAIDGRQSEGVLPSPNSLSTASTPPAEQKRKV